MKLHNPSTPLRKAYRFGQVAFILDQNVRLKERGSLTGPPPEANSSSPACVVFAPQMSGDKGISAFPESDNLYKWVGTIHGAAGTVSAGLGEVSVTQLSLGRGGR